MKKLLSLLLALGVVCSLAGCAGSNDASQSDASQSSSASGSGSQTDASQADGSQTDAQVMSYDEYMAAAVDEQVTIEAYVQAKQSWWEDKATVYAQDEDGAYFLYNMVCSQEDYDKLVPGTCIRVTGYKAEWSGEILRGQTRMGYLPQEPSPQALGEAVRTFWSQGSALTPPEPAGGLQGPHRGGRWPGRRRQRRALPLQLGRLRHPGG